MKKEINGYNINYVLTGEGDEYVVILQGWGTKLAVYESMAALLGGRYRVLRFDMPGFGDSDEPERGWSVSDYADFFCDLMEDFGIKKAALIGHSYGGRVIIKLAARDELPFEISRIMLVDSAGIVHKKTFLQKLRAKKYRLLKSIASNSVVYAMFPELIDDWRSRQGSEDYRRASEVMRATLVKAVNEDLREYLGRVRQRVLLVWGSRDTATPIEDARLMDSLLPDSSLSVIEGAGHYSFLDEPGIFEEIMKDYFGV